MTDFRKLLLQRKKECGSPSEEQQLLLVDVLIEKYLFALVSANLARFERTVNKTQLEDLLRTHALVLENLGLSEFMSEEVKAIRNEVLFYISNL